MKRSLSTSLLLYLGSLSVLQAERIYDNVKFTSKKCVDLGYGNDFDVCAILESCTASYDDLYYDDYYDAENEYTFPSTSADGDYYDDDYFLNDGSGSGSGDEGGKESVDEQFVAEVAEVTGSSRIRHAAFGWKIEGSDECLSPGPILRLRRGVNHGLFVRGNEEEGTNLHFHGLHIDATSTGNGDDPRRSVQGNDNLLIYGLNLPADQHHGGTYWYHSHFSGKSWDQVKKGSFGMIVVDENGNDVGTKDDKVLKFLDNEKILIVDNSKEQGHVYQANGQDTEIFHFVQDEWYRMRILSVNTDSHSCEETIRFDDSCTVHAIAHDGIFRFQVPKEEASNSYKLTSSSRLDVAIQCSNNAQIYLGTSTDQSIANIEVDINQSPADVTPFEADGKTWSSARLEYTKDLTSENSHNQWKVTVFETNLNDHHDHSKPLCDDRNNDFSYGSIQEWTLHGIGSHPFHVHTYPMQVIDKCGSGHDAGEYYDSIVGNDGCLVRLNFIDVYGSVYLHCHIFQHADQGATGWINVVKEGNEDTSRLLSSTGPTCSGKCSDVEEESPKCEGGIMRHHRNHGMLRRNRS